MDATGCRFTWVDDLYFYCKQREMDAAGTADDMRIQHMMAGLRGSAETLSDTTGAGGSGGEAAAQEMARRIEEPSGTVDEGSNRAGTELSEEEAAAQRHAWIKGDVRQSLREARMLAKLNVCLSLPAHMHLIHIHRLTCGYRA